MCTGRFGWWVHIFTPLPTASRLPAPSLKFLMKNTSPKAGESSPRFTRSDSAAWWWPTLAAPPSHCPTSPSPAGISSPSPALRVWVNPLSFRSSFASPRQLRALSPSTDARSASTPSAPSARASPGSRRARVSSMPPSRRTSPSARQRATPRICQPTRD